MTSLTPSIARTLATAFSKVPLRTIFIVPFVVQIVGTVGLVGYLSFKNGQQTVNDLVIRLQSEVNSRIEQHLNSFLIEPIQINQLNAELIDLNLLDTTNLPQLEQYFYQQIRLANISYINLGTPEGEFVGIARVQTEGEPDHFNLERLNESENQTLRIYRLNDQGERVQLLDDLAINPLQDPWYTDAVAAGRPVWSQIYQWQNLDIVSISYSYPIFDRQHRLLGVLGTDLKLSHISDFLRSLELSSSGKMFILERNGLMVASSDANPPFQSQNGDVRRLLATESHDSLIRATAQHLLDRFGSFDQIQFAQPLTFQADQQTIFVNVAPWTDAYGLDWLIVEAVPESDFMAQIHHNTRNTLLLSALALAFALGVGILTARWITHPLLNLKVAAAALAEGKFDQPVTIDRQDELGVLAQAFNSMAAQLQAAFTALRTTNEALEQRVEQRTVELREAKQVADAANQAKSEFLANVSHELRTPLNGILGYAQILLRDQAASPQQQNGVNVIYQCGLHLLNLINDVLDLSKIEARKLELVPTEWNLADFLKGVVEICVVRTEQKSITFTTQFPHCLTPQSAEPALIVYADDKRLRQVLLNLLGNAIKFTDTGAVIFRTTLRSRTPSIAHFRFEIIDTGVGMTPEQLQKIFLPFEQVGDRRRQTEGTGLGLAISQQIVQLMGSRIQVESAIGQGSRFWFDVSFPTVANWVEGPILETEFLRGYAGDRRTILVVDDRWENRAIIVDLLEPLGFQMIEAENGQEGLNQAIFHRPDLIITDLIMPVLDGFAMTKQLRQQEGCQQLPIIASSASVFHFDRQQSQAAGCNGFLPKPIQVDDLLLELQRHLHLDWVCDRPREFTAASASLLREDLIPPPQAELDALYQVAQIGDIDGIEKLAAQIQTLDPCYRAFSNRLFKLAQEMDDEAVIRLIQPYRASAS